MTPTRHSKPEIDADEGESPNTPSEHPPHSSGVHRTAKPRAAWTVAEKFERDGFRYRLMRQPIDGEELGPRLAPREEQALVLACNGDSNRQIAAALGVSPSTVGVLLFRAASKFGVKTRQELLVAYRRSIADACEDER